MLNLFGGKKTESPKKEMEEILNQILEKGGLFLSFQVSEGEGEHLKADIFGEDEGLLKTRGGLPLQALQTYFLCALKKKFPDSKPLITVDSNGFWEEKQSRLFSLVDELAEKALAEQSPTVLKKPLSPNERRLIHERISKNKKLTTVSFGEGFYKSIKFVPESGGNK